MTTIRGVPDAEVIAPLVPRRDGQRLRGTFGDGTPLLLQVPEPFAPADAVAATHRP